MKVRVLLYTLMAIATAHVLSFGLSLLTPLPLFATLQIVFAVLEPGFTLLVLWTLSKQSSPFQKSWRTGSLSLLFFVIGTMLEGYFILQDLPHNPFLADSFFVVAGVLFVLTMLRLPRPDTPRLKGLKLFVDVAVVVVTFITYIWRFTFAPQLVAQDASPLTVAFQALFLFLTLGAFGVMLELLFWTKFSKRLFTLFVGMVCFTAGNILFSLFAPHQEYAQHLAWVLLILAAAYTLLSWGTFQLVLKPYDVSVIDPTSSFARFISRAPYSGVVACYLLILAPPPKDSLVSVGVIVGIILITFIVLTRQFLQLADNEALAKDFQLLSANLEQRVLERSKQLEDSQSRLLASEKLASLGRLTAGLAHEINTPLAAAMHNLYHAKELTREYKVSLGNPSVTVEDHKEIAKELETNLESAHQSLERLGEFVRRMRSQTRLSSEVATFYPSTIIRDVIAVLQPKAKELNATVGFFEPSNVVTLYGDASRFSQVVSNLLTNALDACKGKTGAFVNVRLVWTEQEVRLEIQDNGVGIPQDLQHKIFEPMFTTKEVGQGTGLGLAVVYDIVHGSFQGEIEVSSVVGQGSTFTARFPQSTSLPAKVNV